MLNSRQTSAFKYAQTFFISFIPKGCYREGTRSRFSRFHRTHFPIPTSAISHIGVKIYLNNLLIMKEQAEAIEMLERLTRWLAGGKRWKQGKINSRRILDRQAVQNKKRKLSASNNTHTRENGEISQ